MIRLMPTWDEVQGYLRAKYRLSRDEPGWLGMEWQVDLDGPDGKPVSQRLKIERIVAFDHPWLLLLAAVCSEDNVEARSALRYNALLPIGSLAVENGRCYLRAPLPLDDLTWAALDRAIEFMAREATKLRGRSKDSTTVAHVFRGFAD